MPGVLPGMFGFCGCLIKNITYILIQKQELVFHAEKQEFLVYCIWRIVMSLNIAFRLIHPTSPQYSTNQHENDSKISQQSVQSMP